MIEIQLLDSIELFKVFWQCAAQSVEGQIHVEHFAQTHSKWNCAFELIVMQNQEPCGRKKSDGANVRCRRLTYTQRNSVNDLRNGRLSS